MACVLLQDFLFKKSLGCQDKLKECILRHKSRLSSEFVKAKIKFGEPASAVDEAKNQKKYVRLNQLRGKCDEILGLLKKTGFKEVKSLEELSEEQTFTVDAHINNLVVMDGKVNLSMNPLYLDGSLIIQDKASCMPAFLLDPPPGSCVVDSCSAPGNKTSHLAAIVGKSGCVFAFERDERRFETLCKMLDRAGCSHVKPTCGDFLALNPLDPKYEKVEYCLVDPSCSGSGIIKDHENIADDPRGQSERLSKLSSFQKMIVRHAMKFPNLKRLVYSTCSIHEEENEMVVQEVLEKEPTFELVKAPLPTWHRRGLDKYPFAADVIRADPIHDGMHGFFVALFTKI